MPERLVSSLRRETQLRPRDRSFHSDGHAVCAMSGIEELERAADLCDRIDFSPRDRNLTTGLLEPLAGFLGAETASFRSLSKSEGAVRPGTVVSLGIPDAVNDAYRHRYFRFDPARRLVNRRLDKPLFTHPAKHGEWSQEHATPALLRQYRDEFQTYYNEFLLPNNFFHHLGFCIQDLDGHMLLFDFHRVARSPAFGRLEVARIHVAARYLHAKASQRRHSEITPPAAPVRDPGRELSARELEVAAAVAAGLSNKEVAATLKISVRTVENHMRAIFAKLGVTTRTRLAARVHETLGGAHASTSSPRGPAIVGSSRGGVAENT